MNRKLTINEKYMLSFFSKHKEGIETSIYKTFYIIFTLR